MSEIVTLTVDDGSTIHTSVHESEDAATRALYLNYADGLDHVDDVQTLIDRAGLVVYIETHAMPALYADREAVDKIATMLGTEASWSGADMLEAIADVIGTVRPHPGDSAEDYANEFQAITGRSVHPDYVADDEDDDTIGGPWA